MCLVVVLRIVDRLDRDFDDGISSCALKEHLSLEFEALARHFEELLHKSARDAAKPCLGVSNMHARDVGENFLGDGVSDPAFPRNSLSIEAPDSQDKLARVIFQGFPDRQDAFCCVLAVRIRGDRAFRIRIGVKNMLEGSF